MYSRHEHANMHIQKYTHIYGPYLGGFRRGWGRLDCPLGLTAALRLCHELLDQRVCVAQVCLCPLCLWRRCPLLVVKQFFLLLCNSDELLYLLVMQCARRSIELLTKGLKLNCADVLECSLCEDKKRYKIQCKSDKRRR